MYLNVWSTVVTLIKVGRYFVEYGKKAIAMLHSFNRRCMTHIQQNVDLCGVQFQFGGLTLVLYAYNNSIVQLYCSYYTTHANEQNHSIYVVTPCARLIFFNPIVEVWGAIKFECAPPPPRSSSILMLSDY